MSKSYHKCRAVASLVTGILGIVLGFIGFVLSIIAWRLGHTTLIGMREGTIDSKNMPLAKAGKIIGMIGTLLWCASIVIIMILVAIFGA